MNFTKLLTSCKENRQGVSNQTFNLCNQTNMEEAENGAKRTLSKQWTTKMQMKNNEKRKWHHAKYKWKLVRIKAAPCEGWKEKKASEGEEEVASVRRRQRWWGVGDGEENVTIREKWYPKVNISLEIPNFNSRELPTDVVYNQIFFKIHSHAKKWILYRLESPNRRNMGYILRRLTPSNRHSIFSVITKFSNFEFLLFFSLSYVSYEWQPT